MPTISAEDKLNVQGARPEADPSLEGALGRVQYHHEPGVEKADLRYEGPDDTLVNVHLGSGLYRRTVFDRVGLFNPALRFSEDHDWFLRARGLAVRITILSEVTLLYRLHGKNMTRTEPAGDFNLLKVLKASLHRRRAVGGGRFVPCLVSPIATRPTATWSVASSPCGTTGSISPRPCRAS